MMADISYKIRIKSCVDILRGKMAEVNMIFKTSCANDGQVSFSYSNFVMVPEGLTGS